MTHDLRIINARVFGAPGATAIQVRGGRIDRVGSEAETGRAGEVIDAAGGLVSGLDDAHIHLRSGARRMADAQLKVDDTLEKILERIGTHAAATPDRPWVLGRGWVYAQFPGNLPTAATLDAVARGEWRDHRPRGRRAVRAPGRRRLDAAVPR